MHILEEDKKHINYDNCRILCRFRVRLISRIRELLPTAIADTLLPPTSGEKICEGVVTQGKCLPFFTVFFYGVDFNPRLVVPNAKYPFR